MNKLLGLLVLVTFFSCNSEETKSKLELNIIFEDLENAKADWPGLYFEKDSLVTIIEIINKDGEIINNVLYKGLSDTLWTNIINRRIKLGIETKDTIVNTFIARPIPLNEAELVLYFMSFNDSYVVVKRNKEVIYKGNVQTFKTKVVIQKNELRDIEIFIDNQKFNLKTFKEYNFIEMIKKDTVLDCTYLYFSPV